MTRDDTIKALYILKIAYPQFYKDMTREEGERVVDLWAMMFDGDDPLLVINAVKSFIATDTKGFPPAIGLIKKKMRDISHPDLMTEMDAWNYVKIAVRNSLYNAKQEFDKLPPTIQSLIGSHNVLREWAMLDSGQFDTVVQSNFMRSFKARHKHEQDYQALPESVKAYSKQIANNFNMDRLIGAGKNDR